MQFSKNIAPSPSRFRTSHHHITPSPLRFRTSHSNIAPSLSRLAQNAMVLLGNHTPVTSVPHFRTRLPYSTSIPPIHIPIPYPISVPDFRTLHPYPSLVPHFRTPLPHPTSPPHFRTPPQLPASVSHLASFSCDSFLSVSYRSSCWMNFPSYVSMVSCRASSFYRPKHGLVLCLGWNVRLIVSLPRRYDVMTLRKPIVTWYVKTFRNVNYVC